MSGGQAIAIAAGFVAAVFALGMGAGMFADWLRVKKERKVNDQKESPATAAARVITDNGLPSDGFNGDTPHLINCMRALVNLNDAGALTPHGIGGHARTLLLAAATRLEATHGVEGNHGR
jgi:hypothetical protein